VDGKDFNEAEQLPLPNDWTDNLKSAVIHVVALARVALAGALSERPSARAGACCGCTCGGCRCARLESELALLQTERDIHHARLDKIPADRRPRLLREHRLHALELIAARGWSLARAAEHLLVTRQTLARWLKVSNGGKDPSALLALASPVNRFPDFVGYTVQRLKSTFPLFGKQRIASILARAGIAISATTIGRMLRRPPISEPEPEAEVTAPTAFSDELQDGSSRTVTSKRPNHVWNVDTSVVPTLAGLWVPWIPFSLAPSWPFCWHVAVVFDHFSRSPIDFRVFRTNPTAVEIAELLDSAVERAGCAPRHIISDKGSQFWHGDGPSETYGAWCKRHGVKPRFGAVGKKGSIAILERFWRSMKQECTRRILVPFGIDAMFFEIGAYIRWYSTVRPHTGLGGATPSERYSGGLPGNVVRFETRPRYPIAQARGSPRIERVSHFKRRVTYLEGCRHLPCVELDRVA
jgi:transposase InsO family protein